MIVSPVSEYDVLEINFLIDEVAEISFPFGLGKTRVRFLAPLSPREIEQAVMEANPNLMRNSLRSSKRLDLHRELGMQLYNAIFDATRERHYRRANEMAEDKGEGLRLYLNATSPKIANLPWEFLHDGQVFLNLSRRTQLVRRPTALSSVAKETAPSTKLRVLLVRGKGADDGEVDKMEDIADSSEGRLELVSITDGSQESLHSAVDDYTFELLHFTGLVSEQWNEMELLLDDHVLAGEEVAEMLAAKEELRAVILSTSQSDEMANMVASKGPASIGMRGKISNAARLRFMEGFYRQLMAEASLESAMVEGRQEINRGDPRTREWGLPVYYDLKQPGPVVSWQEQSAGGALESSELEPPADPDKRRIWERVRARLQISEKNLQALYERQSLASVSKIDYLQLEIEGTEQEIEKYRSQLIELSAEE